MFKIYNKRSIYSLTNNNFTKNWGKKQKAELRIYEQTDGIDKMFSLLNSNRYSFTRKMLRILNNIYIFNVQYWILHCSAMNFRIILKKEKILENTSIKPSVI